MWETEQHYRALLQGRSLVMEAEVSEDEALRALVDVGQKYFLVSSAENRRWTLERYIGHFLIGAVACGQVDYDEGTFWPFLGKRMGGTLEQKHIQDVTEAWSNGLNRFGLSRFELPLKYVGEILMHGGIPQSSIGSLVDALDHLDGRIANMTAEQFVHRVAMLDGQDAYISFGVSRPTWRFLRDGGDIAIDFVNRVLLTLDAFREDPAGEIQSGLPESVIEKIRDRVTASGIRSNRSKRTNKGPRRVNMNPFVTFDESKGVRVSMPQLEVVTGATIHWRVDTETGSTTFTAHPPFPGEITAVKHHMLTAPTRKVVIAATTALNSDQQATWALDVISPEDPLLFFDADNGALIRANGRIPKGRVWVAYPLGKDVNPIDEELEIDGHLQAVNEEVTVYGWDGWAFRLVDLTNVTKLRLSADARLDLKINGTSPWRHVSSTSRPRLDNLVSVPYVTVTGVKVVSNTVPHIVIPGVGRVLRDQDEVAREVAGPKWSVSVFDAKTGLKIHGWALTSKEDDTAFDLWPEDHEPVVGVFDVVLTGPLGKGFTERVAIFEGLETSSSLAFRHLTQDGEGLETATVTMQHPSVALAETVELAGHEPEKLPSENSPFATWGVTASVPHASITKTQDRHRETSLTPLVFQYEAIKDVRLTVNEPMGNRFCRLVAVLEGGVEQDVLETGRTEAKITFDLSQLLDTLADTRSCKLYVEMNFERTLVGRVQPMQIATGIIMSTDGRLILDMRYSTPGLVAAVWPKFAPWSDPLVVDLDSRKESDPIDSKYSMSGSAIVELAIENPWNPISWERPVGKLGTNSFEIATLPLANSDDESSRAQRWVSGDIEEPGELSLEFLVRAFTGLFNVGANTQFVAARSAVASMIGEHPRRFSHAINEATIDRSTLIALLVESGLISKLVGPSESASSLWNRQPTLALVCKAGISDQEFGYSRAREEAFGISASKLASGEIDEHASVGSFKDPTAQALDSIPVTQLDGYMAAARPIPGHVLDRDERMIHARELFDVRHDPALTGVIANGEQLLRLITECVTHYLGEEGVAPIVARESTPGWKSLPALSIALALANRLAARNNEKARAITQVTKTYFAALAMKAPAFVDQDIILAELWLCGWEESNGTN